MNESFEYLIIMYRDKDIEGYYLLTDSAMAEVDQANNFWEYLSSDHWDDYHQRNMVSRDGTIRCFQSLGDLSQFIIDNKIILTGEWTDSTY